MSSNRLPFSFYNRDVLDVAPDLLGKVLVRKYAENVHNGHKHKKENETQKGQIQKYIITEVEAYRGEEDLACHASKKASRSQKSKRTQALYDQAGKLYIYLIYGMYYMLNIVTGPKNHPQAVLIRAVQTVDSPKKPYGHSYDPQTPRIRNLTGPGKLAKELKIDKSFYGEDLTTSQRIWLETGTKVAKNKNNQNTLKIIKTPRIGVEYAGEWASKEWRFVLEKDK